MARRKTSADGNSARDIARRVRNFRTSSKLTQEELARAANVTAKFVSQIENGHVNVSFAVLQRLVEDGLGMPLSTFFTSDPADALDGEATTIAALLAGQPVAVRQCAIRLVRALVAIEDEPRHITGRRRS